ncbi:MAG: DUF3450 domain-containing protein [Thiotrichales bacterium]|nr:DUF3450 domain-containing protein [Thiotrichales bacterium]
MQKTITIHATAILCLVLSLTVMSADDPLKSAVKTKLKAQKQNITSQERIDALADETRDIVQEYRSAIRSTDSLKIYNRQLDKLVKNQHEKLASISRQLGNIEETQRDIVPLMLRMIKVLEEFIALDLPFLVEERSSRLAAIKEMMDRPDVTLPDKYRRILQAYQIEMEYGRTIEAYTDSIGLNGQDNTVDVLRIGRLSLLYITLDNRQAGYWDNDSKSWKTLPDEYLRSIQRGIKIARKQTSPDLFEIPVSAAEVQK